MRFEHKKHQAPMPASQRGVVLIAGLLMVVLLTVIALAAIRGSGLQESMAFNMRDNTMAFQAAESSLRACEFRISQSTDAPPIACVKDGGVCKDLNLTPADSVNNNPDYWLERARNMNATLSLPDIEGVYEQPKCLIEVIGSNIAQCNLVMGNSLQIGATPPNCRFSYRVTARGIGAEKSTQVILQSTYSN